ncbi:DUF3117 domain-containing protein [Streptomyces sp. NPDC006430]
MRPRTGDGPVEATKEGRALSPDAAGALAERTQEPVG